VTIISRESDQGLRGPQLEKNTKGPNLDPTLNKKGTLLFTGETRAAKKNSQEGEGEKERGERPVRKRRNCKKM